MHLIDYEPGPLGEAAAATAVRRIVSVSPPSFGSVAMFRKDELSGVLTPHYENHNLVVNSSRQILAHLLAGGEYATRYGVNTVQFGDVCYNVDDLDGDGNQTAFIFEPLPSQLPTPTRTGLVHAFPDLTIVGEPGFMVNAVSSYDNAQTGVTVHYAQFKITLSWGDRDGWRSLTEMGMFSEGGGVDDAPIMYSYWVFPSFVLNRQSGLVTLWTILF